MDFCTTQGTFNAHKTLYPTIFFGQVTRTFIEKKNKQINKPRTPGVYSGRSTIKLLNHNAQTYLKMKNREQNENQHSGPHDAMYKHLSKTIYPTIADTFHLRPYLCTIFCGNSAH